MKELNLLKQLQNISSTNEKVAFVSEHKDNPLFIALLKFIINDRVITNISRKKFNKEVELLPSKTTINQFLHFLEHECTGKDSDIAFIKTFIAEYTPEEQSIWAEIVCKDIALGMSTKLYNKAVDKKDMINEMVYMGAIPYDQKKVAKLFQTDGKLLSQLKCDGMFLASVVTENKVYFLQRSGIPMLIDGILPEELSLMRKFEGWDFMLNGEILISDVPNRAEANGILRGLLSSKQKIYNGDEKEYAKFTKKYGRTIEDVESKLEYWVWDIVPVDILEGVECNTLYETRFNKVKYLVNSSHRLVDGKIKYISSIKLVPTREVSNETEAMEHFQELLGLGFEGTILKSKIRGFKSTKPNFQIKFKAESEIELEIIDFEAGAPNTKYSQTLGSLICKSSCGTLVTGVSGFSDSKRDEIYFNKAKYLGKIITVKINGLSSNVNGGVGVLYPVFIEERFEKSEANSWNEIIEIMNGKIGVK